MHFSDSTFVKKPCVFPVGEDTYKHLSVEKPDGLYHKAFPPRTKLIFNAYKKSIKPVTFSESIFKGHELKYSKSNLDQCRNSNMDWIIGVVLFVFILSTWVRITAEKRFIQILKCFISSRPTAELSREGIIFSQRGSIELFITFIFSTSLLIYLVCDYFYPAFDEANGFLTYVKIVTIITGIYVSKFIILKVLGSVFNIANEMGEYITNIFVFNEIFGLVILPLLILIAYSSFFDILFIDVAIVIFILFYLYRLLRGVLIGTKNLKFSKFYLFLYLCTLEILPLMVLIKITFRFFEIKI